VKNKGRMHFFAGKMAAGKSTLSKELATEENTILISEDVWLEHLFKDEIKTFQDYILYSSRLKPLIKEHVISLLDNETSVVLDFPANTKKQRAWFLEIINLGYSHQLHYIDASDELCLKQLALRSDGIEGSAFTTEEMFHEVTSYFEPPSKDEQFDIKVYKRENA